MNASMQTGLQLRIVIIMYVVEDALPTSENESSQGGLMLPSGEQILLLPEED